MGSAIERFLQERTGGRSSGGAPPLVPRDTATTLRAAEQASSTTTPDSAARVLRLQAATGLPRSVIEGDLDGIESATRAQEFDPVAYAKQSPLMAAWLSEDPNNLGVARGDVDILAQLEQASRDRNRDRPRPGGIRNLLRGITIGGIAGTEGGIGAAASAAGRSLTTDIVEREETGNQLGFGLAAVLFPTALSLLSRGGEMRESAAERREESQPTVGSFTEVETAADLRDYLAFQLGQAVGSMGVIVGGTLVAGPAGGLAAGTTLAYGDVRDELDDLGGPESAGTRDALALALGIPVALLDRITPGQIASKLLARGASQAIVREAAQHGLTRQVAAELLRTAAQEGGTEVAQEMLQHLGTRLATGAPLEPGQLAVRAVDAAIGGAVGGGTFGGVSAGLDVQRLRQAQQSQQFYTALGDAAQRSELVKRMPEKMAEAVERLTAGGPTETSYVDPETFVEYFQERDADPAAEAEVILGQGGAQALAEAIATGAPLAIPTSRYAVTIAPSEHHGFFVQHLRLGRPDALNQVEADQLIAEIRQVAEAEVQPEDVSADAIEAQVLEQLRAAGMDESEASANARLMATVFRTLGVRTGQDPAAIFDQLGLTITREGMEAAAPVSGEPISRPELVRRALAIREARETPAAEPDVQLTAEEELEARLEREAIEAEEVVSPLAAYGLPLEERDVSLKTPDGEWVYARTPAGALRTNLETVSTDGLIDELARAEQANSMEDLSGRVTETDVGETIMARRPSAFHAAGRVAARQKTIARVEAELERRGVSAEQVADGIFRMLSGVAQEEADALSFDFSEEFFQSLAVTRFARTLQTIESERRELAERREAGETDQAEAAQAVDADATIQRILTAVEAERRRLAAEREPVSAEEEAIGLPDVVSFEQSAGERPSVRWAAILEEIAAEARAVAERREAGEVVERRQSRGVEVDAAIQRILSMVEAERRQLAAEREPMFEQRDPAAVTETPEFRAWFGDSKVVDADGNPLVVYHGSPDVRMIFEEGFRSFSRGEVFFATDDFATANSYTDESRAWDYQNAEGQVVPLYLSIQNPMIVDAGGRVWSDTERHVREAKEAGHDGIIIRNSRDNYQDNTRSKPVTVYAFFNPTQAKSAITTQLRSRTDGLPIPGALPNVGTFDPNDPSILRQGSGDVRGRIRFTASGVTIELLRSANLSTFLHETGHLYLEVIKNLAADENSAEGVRQDWQLIQEWLGVQEGESLTREQHEKWARGFEAYLMEGKAPNAELRTLFQRFRAWLTFVYRELRNLNVELTDEVRGVMDRLVATDEEIQAAEQELGRQPILDREQAVAVLGEAGADRYLALAEETRATAEERLGRRLMDAFLRERTAVWRAERVRVREEVAAELNQEPTALAHAMLSRGTMPDGSALPEGVEPIKLSREAILRDFVHLSLPDEDQSHFLRRFRGLYARDGGNRETVHPDVVAELYGFRSGDALLRALLTTQPARQRIEQLTDERMRERHEDPLTSASLPEEAMAAVHGDERAKLLQEELKILMSEELATFKNVTRRTARPIRRVPDVQQARELAGRLIGQRKVKDIKPEVFRRAEAKAARRAVDALLKGDVELAFAAKQQELLNHELVRAATEAREAIQKGERTIRNLFKSDEKLAKSRDMDLVNAARAIAGSWGLGPQIDSPLEFLEQLRAYELDTYEALVQQVQDATAGAAAAAGDFRNATYDQFVGLRDTIEGLWSLSRRAQQMMIDGQLRDREEIQAELTARVREIQTRDYAERGRRSTLSDGDKVVNTLLSWRAALRRVESWVDAMDSKDPNGVFRRYIWQPISEAAERYQVVQRDTIQRYVEMLQKIEPGLRQSGPIEAPELGFTFRNKGEVIAALLHTGNESNLDKLVRGHGWDPAAFDAFVRRAQAQGIVTKADYDFLQEVWDLLEELKPEAQRTHKSLYGYYFNEVTANPVTTPWGTYRGGYFPARVDPERSSDAARREAADGLLNEDNSFMFPSTGRGFTKSRVQQYARPLSLDLQVAPQHIAATLRFIHIQPAIRDAGRLVTNREFRAVLESFDPAATDEMLVPWLQRTARQSVSAPAKTNAERRLNSFWRQLRARSGLFIMAGNVKNALEQFTGLSVAMTHVPPRYMKRSLLRYIQNPRATTDAVAEKSTFMDGRVMASTFDIQRRIEDLVLDPNAYEKAQSFASRHGYILQQMTQNLVDTITWSAKYEQAIEGGANEVEAIRQADAAVRLTQGSFAPQDISRAEAGTPWQRAFLMFYSYFNMQANLQGTEFVVAMREMGLKKATPRLLYVYFLAHIVPSVISEVLQKAIRGEPWDEDEDGWLIDDMLALFFGSQARAAAAMVPGVGQFATAAFNRWNDKWYDDRISTSPAISLLESAAGAASGRSIWRAATGEGSKKPAVRDALSLISLLSGIPTMPLVRGAGYLIDVQEGNVQPRGTLDFMRGILSGTGPR